jgi:hypothetical protein
MEQKHHVLTLFDAMRLHDPIERSFAVTAIRAGVTVESGHSIRSPIPVRDKNGELKKMVHNPDFYLRDQKRAAHVEVGNGIGENPSKRAQRRVVKAAGVTNYNYLSGRQVHALEPVPDNAILSIFRRTLKWK